MRANNTHRHFWIRLRVVANIDIEVDMQNTESRKKIYVNMHCIAHSANIVESGWKTEPGSINNGRKCGESWKMNENAKEKKKKTHGTHMNRESEKRGWTNEQQKNIVCVSIAISTIIWKCKQTREVVNIFESCFNKTIKKEQKSSSSSNSAHELELNERLVSSARQFPHCHCLFICVYLLPVVILWRKHFQLTWPVSVSNL